MKIKKDVNNTFGSTVLVPEIQNMKRFRLAFILLVTECILIIIFVAFSSYYPDADASDKHNSIHSVHGGFEPDSNTIVKYRTCKCFHYIWIIYRNR